MADDDPNLQRRRLRLALRKHREDAGLTQRDAAAALEWSISKLVRIEGGNQGVSATDLQALLQLYGVTGEHVTASLKALARASRGKPWWHEYRDVVSPQFAQYLGYENSASSLTAFHPFLLPGLLHTQAYAAGVLNLLGDPERTRRAAELRTKRQQHLFADPDAVSLHFIVNEEALHRWIGGRETLTRQLQHVRDISERPNVSLSIVPFSAGAHPGLYGPFTVVRIDGTQERLVYLESMDGHKHITDDLVNIERYHSYVTELTHRALARQDGDALLKRRIEQLQ